MFETTQEMTEAAGRPGLRDLQSCRARRGSRHNLIYWRYGDYAGVGPGAHGRLTLNGKRIATAANSLPERWRETVAQEATAFAEMTPVSR